MNTGSVTNVAYATGSFNNQPVNSPQNIVTVRFKQPTNNIAHNGGPDNGGYGGAVVPMVPGPAIDGISVSSSAPNEHTSEPDGYTSEPPTTEAPTSYSNDHKANVSLSKGSKAKLSGSKAKTHLTKHKHKNHYKHHKTGKNHSK
jgi:hypothetical protein